MIKLTYCANLCDVYNENYIYSKYGYGAEKNYRIYGKTMHGWLEFNNNFSADFLLQSTDKINDKSILCIVHRSDQEAYLRGKGFHNTHAIGSPFIYVPKTKANNRQGHLVMAQHGIDKKNVENFGFSLKEYVQKLITNEFRPNDLTVVIHGNDIDNENLVGPVQELGVKVVMGARGLDGLTFIRLAELFSTSVSVITNAYGSHIPYANYFGCKIEFRGPFFQPRWEYLNHLPWFGTVVTKEEWCAQAEIANISSLEKRFPFLFEKPSRVHNKWAGEQLGESQKKTPEELAKIFGWNWANDFKYVFRKCAARSYKSLFRKSK